MKKKRPRAAISSDSLSTGIAVCYKVFSADFWETGCCNNAERNDRDDTKKSPEIKKAYHSPVSSAIPYTERNFGFFP